MTFAVGLVLVVSVLYTAAGLAELVGGRPAHATIFAGYVLANLGLLWSMK